MVKPILDQGLELKFLSALIVLRKIYKRSGEGRSRRGTLEDKFWRNQKKLVQQQVSKKVLYVFAFHCGDKSYHLKQGRKGKSPNHTAYIFWANNRPSKKHSCDTEPQKSGKCLCIQNKELKVNTEWESKHIRNTTILHWWSHLSLTPALNCALKGQHYYSNSSPRIIGKWATFPKYSRRLI